MARTMQPSFAGGELSPALHARVDLGKYDSGLAECTNYFVRSHGGISNRPGFEYIAEAHDSTAVVRLIPFSFNTEQTYVLEFGDQYMRVIKDGGMVLEANKSIAAISQANPARVTVTGHSFSTGDRVYIDSCAGMTEPNGRFFQITYVDANNFTLDGFDSSALSAYTGSGTVARIYKIATTYTAAQLADLKFTQSADTMTLCHPAHPIRELTRTGHAAWTLTAFSVGSSQAAPTSPSVTPTGSGSITYSYVITAVNDTTGEESLPTSAATTTNNLATSGNSNAVSWTAASGADRYNIYKQDNGGVHGYVGTSTGTSFTDRNVQPDYTSGAPLDVDPFPGADDYPAVPTYYQQRLVFAHTNNKPQGMWFSQTANFNNFNHASPRKADDAIDLTIASLQVNEIRHMVPLEDLLVFTSGGEWAITANGEAFSIETLRTNQQGYRGSADVPPLVVGNTVLFLQARGTTVRDLAYTLSGDASVAGYVGNDLTILARHLFEGYTLTEWAYAQAPDSIVWAVRSDGDLLGFTYLREHEVWAWHRHETDGTFESVTSIAEGSEDAVYAVVQRTIDGNTKRYIERLHSRQMTDVTDAFFVDSGLTYDGSATTTITGLHHLEGETVAILADGNVQPTQTVTNGAITLAAEHSKVHVGLPYTGQVRTLPLNIPLRGDTLQGRRKTIQKVTLRVEDTQGIWIGPSTDAMTERKPSAPATYDGARSIITQDIDVSIRPNWNTRGQFYIQQQDPLPSTILAAIPEVAVGG